MPAPSWPRIAGNRPSGIGARKREFVGVADAGRLDLDQHLAGARAFELNGHDFERLARLMATAARTSMAIRLPFHPGASHSKRDRVCACRPPSRPRPLVRHGDTNGHANYRTEMNGAGEANSAPDRRNRQLHPSLQQTSLTRHNRRYNHNRFRLDRPFGAFDISWTKAAVDTLVPATGRCATADAAQSVGPSRQRSDAATDHSAFEFQRRAALRRDSERRQAT